MLENLEYLQGIADRAYQRLVQSGDYSYRTLARFLEEAIEEGYKRVVDPDWVEYRARTAHAKSSLKQTAKQTALGLILAERPTNVPLGHQDFNGRQALIAQLRQNTFLYRTLRRAWHLVPEPFRKVVWRGIGYR